VKEEAKKYLFAQFGCVGDGGLSFLYGKNTIHIFHVCGCVVWCPGWEGRDVIIFCLIFFVVGCHVILCYVVSRVGKVGML
jgi:hypothetical protein